MQSVQKKLKVLFISDHPLSTSGVGSQARFLINGLLATGRYTFRCFGAALKHDNLQVQAANEDFIIKPTEGFGDINLIRQVLVSEKPDAMFIFTDPRFFQHVFFMEDEIHQVCPIAYWHLWDNSSLGTEPSYNKPLYDSCDVINCINYPTYEFVSKWYPETTRYVPHAVPKDLYFPVKNAADVQNYRRAIVWQQRMNDFIVLWVGRNAKRKNPGDIVQSFKLFLDELQAKHGHRNSTLVMHTDPHDEQGPDLIQVVEKFGVADKIVFTHDRIDFQKMNVLYNACDVGINKSCAEGFGLPILETKQCGKPVIAIKTGGLSRQVEDQETGEQFGVALDPEVRNLVGTQSVPWIYDDFVSNKTFADALMKVYEMGKEGRASVGERAAAHVAKNYDINNVVKQWDETLTELVQKWRAKQMPNNKRWLGVEL